MNLINPTGWQTGGVGTVTVTNGAIKLVNSIVTTSYARQAVTTKPGHVYRLAYVSSTATVVRFVGTTVGAENLFAAGAPEVGSLSLVFTATTTTAWINFERRSIGTSDVSEIYLVDTTPDEGYARTTNGTSSYLNLDQVAQNLPRRNAGFFIGGWFSFPAVPTANTFLFECGKPAQATGGRMRLIANATTRSLRAQSLNNNSSQQSIVDLFSRDFLADTPYFLGIIAQDTGAVHPVYNKVQTGGTAAASFVSGYVPEETVENIRIGAQVAPTPPTTFYAVRVWDFFVHRLPFPTTTIIDQIVDGARPNRISGFTPSMYWPMDSTADEYSVTGKAIFTAVNGPGSVSPVVVTPAATDLHPIIVV